MTRSFRFQPEPLDHALIDFNFEGKDFHPSAVALIMNESYTGCSLVIKTNSPLKAGTQIKTEVGRLGVLPAKIVWTKELAPSVIQVGIQFLE